MRLLQVSLVQRNAPAGILDLGPLAVREQVSGSLDRLLGDSKIERSALPAKCVAYACCRIPWDRYNLVVAFLKPYCVAITHMNYPTE